MLLYDLLQILGVEKVALLSGVSIDTAKKWFVKRGKSRGVPDLNALVALADFMKLNDRDLGSLVRDVAVIRIDILKDQFAATDPKKGVSSGSRIMRVLRSQAALNKLLEEEIEDLSSVRRNEVKKEHVRDVLDRRKERYLERERERSKQKEEEETKRQKIKKLEEQLSNIKTKNNKEDDDEYY